MSDYIWQENINSSKQWEFTEKNIKRKNVLDLFHSFTSLMNMFLFGKTNHFQFILLAYSLKAFLTENVQAQGDLLNKLRHIDSEEKYHATGKRYGVIYRRYCYLCEGMYKDYNMLSFFKKERESGKHMHFPFWTENSKDRSVKLAI